MRTNIFSRGGKNPRIFLFLALIAVLVESVISFDTYSVSDATSFDADGFLAYDSIELAKEIDTPSINSTYSYYNPTPVSYTASTTNNVINGNYITINGRNLYVEDYNTTASVPDNHVARFVRGKYTGTFYFAHNTNSVFGPLLSYDAGSTFSITIDGVTKNYRVAYAVTVPNDDVLAANMKNIASSTYNGVKYDVSLMTCAGSPLPGRDATHRRLIFANQI